MHPTTKMLVVGEEALLGTKAGTMLVLMRVTTYWLEVRATKQRLRIFTISEERLQMKTAKLRLSLPLCRDLISVSLLCIRWLYSKLMNRRKALRISQLTISSTSRSPLKRKRNKYRRSLSITIRTTNRIEWSSYSMNWEAKAQPTTTIRPSLKLA